MSRYNTYSNEDLLHALKQGDEYAFREIYERYSEGLSEYAVRLTDSLEEANDVIQELFINIWKNRSDLQISSSLSSYLFASVRYGCFRALENTKRRKTLLNSLASYMEASVDFSGNLDAREMELRLDQIVRVMPERMRAVYVLSREEKLSHREISQRLNIAEGTSRKQIKRALRFIRLQLRTVSMFLVLFR